MRRALASLAVILGLLIVFAVWGYANALADPVIRRVTVPLAGWQPGHPPIRVALLSDFHVQGPDMPPARVARIVAQVNAEKPDLILLAGDFFGDRWLSTRQYSDAEIAAPLAGLRAPLGVYGVLGNHDHMRHEAPMVAALQGAGVTMLDNRAVPLDGLVLAGGDDIYTRNLNMKAIERAVRAMPGPAILLSHGPDIAPHASNRFQLVLSGHTHCGQVALPLLGRFPGGSQQRYRLGCGIARERNMTVIISSGLGASIVPLRFGAPPDWWMVTLVPAP